MLLSDRLRILLPASFFAGSLILFIPLVREFHVDFAILGALIGSIWGIIASKELGSKIIPTEELVIPLVGLTAFALPSVLRVLITGCFSFDGLTYWLLYPYPSLLFTYFLTRFLRTISNNPRLWAFLLCFLIAIPAFLIEFFLFPQLYFHNHIWGGWPGPIYDQEVLITDSIFFFRWITLTWTLLFILASFSLRGGFRLFLLALISLSLILSYSRLSENAIISPEAHIQNVLGNELYDEEFNFVIFYPENTFDELELTYYSNLIRFHLTEVRDILEIEDGATISIYVYRNAWQKKQLTGAKFTNFVPVWLSNPQVHINKQDIERVLRHELVHAVATEFGNRLLNASFSIGLVEGLAVAIAPNFSRRATSEQMLAATNTRPDKREIKRIFSLTGFYSGRGPMNYAISGAFVSFLLETQNLDTFKEAYRRSDITVFENLEEIIQQWHFHLDNLEFDEQEAADGQRVFAIPSLFELDCPRKVTQEGRLRNALEKAVIQRDTTRIFELADELMHESGYSEQVVFQNHRLSLRFRRSPRDIDINPMEMPRTTAVLLGAADIARLRGEPALAQQNLIAALQLSEMSSENPSFQLRFNEETWDLLLFAAYYPEIYPFLINNGSHPVLERTAIRNLIQQEKIDTLILWMANPALIQHLSEQPRLLADTKRLFIKHNVYGLYFSIFEEIDLSDFPAIMQKEMDEIRRFYRFINGDDIF